jgi:hypothetical protein
MAHWNAANCRHYIGVPPSPAVRGSDHPVMGLRRELAEIWKHLIGALIMVLPFTLPMWW